MTAALDAARDLFPLIAEAAERTSPGPVPPETVDAIADAGLHAVATPREVGGAELSLVEQLDVYAELARADGSAGWCAMANAVTIAFFGAWTPASFADQLFADGVPLAAGQFAPNGVAVPDGAGYRISGQYHFGSGISHSTWAGAGTMTQPDDGSDPEMRFALMPVDEVELQGNWDVMGLESTASYDYRVDDVWVPEAATFDFFAPERHRGGPMYDLGVLCLTACGHAGFALGVARRVLDELIELAGSRLRMGAATTLAESDRFQVALATVESRWRASDAWLHQVFHDVQPGPDEIVPDLADWCRQATVFATQDLADVTREAYLFAGTTALRDGPLQRGFRDLHAGAQHFFASPAASVDVARRLLEG